MRTILLVFPLVLAACAGNPAPASQDGYVVVRRAERATIDAPDLGIRLRMPQGAWVRGEGGDDAVLSLTYARKRARITVRAAPVGGREFSRLVTELRRDEIEGGVSLGQAQFTMDQFGRHAVFPARRSGETDTEEGYVAFIVLDDLEQTVVIVHGWAPESPLGGIRDDVMDVVNGIRAR